MSDGGEGEMKRRPWLLIEPGRAVLGEMVELGETESRHAAGSLRCRLGDEVILADGRGTIAVGVIRELASKRVVAEIVAVDHVSAPSRDGVTIGLALIDRQPMDWAVQKAVEVGARRFVPVICDRSQRKGRDQRGRLEHWRRLAMQALKQCRRPWSIDIDEPQELRRFVETFAECGLVADAGGRSLNQFSRGQISALAVGPEGGFSPQEFEIFDRAGWLRLKLAANVLRAETAAVVGAALLVAKDEGLL